MNIEKSSIDNYLDTLDKVLRSAVRRGHLERIKVLVEHGADIDTFTATGCHCQL